MFSFLFGNFTKQELVTPALNPSTWKAEVGRSEFSASSSLQIKFQDSQGYTKRNSVSNKLTKTPLQLGLKVKLDLNYLPDL